MIVSDAKGWYSLVEFDSEKEFRDPKLLEDNALASMMRELGRRADQLIPEIHLFAEEVVAAISTITFPEQPSSPVMVKEVRETRHETEEEHLVRLLQEANAASESREGLRKKRTEMARPWTMGARKKLVKW